VKPLDPRLLRYSAAARGYLVVTVVLGLAVTGLILIQASLLARLLAGAATGTGTAVLAGAAGLLLAVLLGRAAASYGGEVTALRAAAAVKSQLRRRLTDHALRLGPSWLARNRSGEVTTLATRGLDGLDAYFARYLPQLVLACLVPLAVLIRIAFADWISAVVIGVTLPLIPVFAILVGLHTKATTQRQWRLLSRLGGHFLDVVEGLPTLKLFGRARPQAEVIGEVTDQYRQATMSTLRVAFLSGFVLELAAALATALVAVEVGLRLLAGHLSYQTALLVLLLTPEAYLPLRAVGAQFHASTEGAAAAQDVFEILDTPVPAETRTPKAPGAAKAPAASDRTVSLRTDAIKLTGVGLAYPGRGDALSGVNLTIRPGDKITLTGPRSAAWMWRPSRWRTGAARSAGCRSSRTCSTRRWPRTSRWATRWPAARPSPGRPKRPGRPRSSRPCRRATTPRSGSTGSGCRPGSASSSRSPARSCGTRRCSCSTSRPRTWMRSAPACLSRPSTR
jgi:ATP-binding cassette subfamily C protein CydD